MDRKTTLPLPLHQTSAQLPNDGVQLSVETMGAIWTQTVWQCWYCWQLRNNSGMKQIKHCNNYWRCEEKQNGERDRERSKLKTDRTRQALYYEYRDIEAHACNHFYSRKVDQFHIYWVLVRRLACAILSSVVCPDLPYFSTLSDKQHDLKNCYLI